MKLIAFFIGVLIISSKASANIFTGIPQIPASQDVFTNLYFKTTAKTHWRIYLKPSGERYALQIFASGKTVKHPLDKNLRPL